MKSVTSLNTPTTGLQVKHISRTLKKRPLLQDISFTVRRGEVVALLGPNGAGKTTCFHAVTGLIPVDSGQILLDGTDVTHWPVYRRARAGLGYLPQEASIFRGLSTEDNIRAILEVTERSKQDVKARLEELLEEFSLTRVRKSPSPALSGGERRRVEIARAIAARPSYILLDEPFAGVDPIAINDVRELVMGLKERGLGVLITDHNVRETLSLVDHACILHDGRMLTNGTPEEIVTNPDVKKVYLGEGFSL
ncbi:MAG: LPS export ABC transporter ATP-binding protein [Alphaproteobacteria bacterium]|nr:LPS export ABC transporter ATP-binding protein [Alphaproteobacteria bacterium]MDD9919837.1 LPS export ABC transporter ATP-binding protein [Alphaproteobacteria bacterium]